MFQKYPVDLGAWNYLLKNDTSESILLHFIVPNLLSTLRFYEQKILNKGNFQGSEIWIVWKNRTKNWKVNRKLLSIKKCKGQEKKTEVKGEKSNSKTGKYAWIDKNCER